VSPDLVRSLSLAAGTALAVAAAVQIWRAVDFLRHAVCTGGRVTRYTTRATERSLGEGRGSETVRHDYPHVEFSLPDGSRVEFLSRLPIILRRDLDPGASVAVAYNPKAPARTAEITGLRTWHALWSRALGFGGLALLLLYLAAKGWPHS
jgi:Protein of unknown function (DUF3592)